MGFWLPVDALPGLRLYKYSSVDNSPLSKWILKPFYTRLIEWFPKWVAPNLITVGGLAFSVLSVAKVLWFNPQVYGAVFPRWVYLAFAGELWMYQTLDALDGQQARRTGSSSPLGELFDHCVDAINTSLQALVICSAFRCGPLTYVISLFASTLNFYLSTWEEYHTGTLYLSAVSGPVEGVLALIGMFVATAVLGPEIWSKPSAQSGLLGGASAAIALNVLLALRNVVKQGDFAKKLRGLIPYCILTGGWILWISLVPQILYQFPIQITLSYGLSFALLVGRIITAHVAHQEFPMYNILHLAPFVGLAFHYLAPSWGYFPMQGDMAALWCFVGLSLGVYGSFVAEIITEITTYLDIGCFYIKKKVE